MKAIKEVLCVSEDVVDFVVEGVFAGVVGFGLGVAVCVVAVVLAWVGGFGSV